MPRRASLLVIALAACGDDAGVPGYTGPPVEELHDGRGCETELASPPLAPGVHVPQCSQVVYPTNPPTSGEHYPSWAEFAVYPARVGRPFWVHDLEHGAIVVAYHCPEGCPAEVDQLTAYLASRPADPACGGRVHARFVVTPDPELDVRFAAIAWGHSLRSTCFDLPALHRFIEDHYARAPEDTCAPGIDPLNAGLPPNCP